jgi:hypothetical protein
VAAEPRAVVEHGHQDRPQEASIGLEHPPRPELEVEVGFNTPDLALLETLHRPALVLRWAALSLARRRFWRNSPFAFIQRRTVEADGTRPSCFSFEAAATRFSACRW